MNRTQFLCLLILIGSVAITTLVALRKIEAAILGRYESCQATQVAPRPWWI